MIGDIRAFNEEILRERRRELGSLPLPACFSAVSIRTAIETGNMSGVSIPYVGRERIKGFRSRGEVVFCDTSGMGSPSEPALTPEQLLQHMLTMTEKYGTLWWGLTEVGQFQGYVKAWKHKGA